MPRSLKNLEAWLAEITGFTGVSFTQQRCARRICRPDGNTGVSRQPPLIITAMLRWYLHRLTVQTLPALWWCAMDVVIGKSDEEKIDVADLKAKAEQCKDKLSCLMVTYPSTHGVFEESIIEICAGKPFTSMAVWYTWTGQTWMHRLAWPLLLTSVPMFVTWTFIKHSVFRMVAVAPGMGPICVNDKLKPVLPGHAVVKTGGEKAIHAVSVSSVGSAKHPGNFVCIHCDDGWRGIKSNATKMAILNANYIKERLRRSYKFYTPAHTVVARTKWSLIAVISEVWHWSWRYCQTVDGLRIPRPYGIIPGGRTLMIEPTESEPKKELDRFCDALIEIRNEIRESGRRQSW